MARDDRAAAPAGRKGVSPVLAVLALLLIVLFAGLGTWQVIRLQWKLDLIARVEARVHAAPAPLPSRTSWAGITPESDEYRRVKLHGTYLYDLTTPVQALTEQGSGYWLLTPMCTEQGIVLVNRGFIATDLGARTRYTPQRAAGNPCANAGPAADVTGLLRTSERNGAFTRTNDPAANRWYTRDVAAIAAARGLAAAPFFVDAAAQQNPPDSPDRPIGGLTVVKFPNSHLVYAFTWYALALMVAGAWWWVARRGDEPSNDERHD
ncbi:SURF1 family protein [Telluria mixta]|uniref:SURF1-like protein n=1 Tax=Telluria mixta TaxID=34071 RepID=A0ABT2C4L7_9BURK|nr:SURF1 family protein [Telluria mixta]MCS0632338.1 SURF1 family protein [Telluria mixta]WEM94907.1 SURF1 family protein [Telluria mixta]